VFVNHQIFSYATVIGFLCALNERQHYVFRVVVIALWRQMHWKWRSSKTKT